MGVAFCAKKSLRHLKPSIVGNTVSSITAAIAELARRAGAIKAMYLMPLVPLVPEPCSTSTPIPTPTAIK